jgi:hypothetical protein
VLAGVGIGLLWMYQRARRWPSATLVAAFVALSVFFSSVGVDRGSSVREIFVEQQVVRDTADYGNLRFMEDMDTGNLEYLEFLVYAVPGKTGTYGYFVGMLQIFTEPIPRVLWRDKPVGEPIKMFNLFDVGNPVGITASLPGYGWMNLGWFGVALWCGLCGSAWGWFYERFAHRPITNMQLLAYITFLPLSILFFRDGGLLTLLRFGLFLAIPIVVFALLAWLFRREQPPQQVTAMPLGSGAQRRAWRAAGQDGGASIAGRDRRRQLASQAKG